MNNESLNDQCLPMLSFCSSDGGDDADDDDDDGDDTDDDCGAYDDDEITALDSLSCLDLANFCLCDGKKTNKP